MAPNSLLNQAYSKATIWPYTAARTAAATEQAAAAAAVAAANAH